MTNRNKKSLATKLGDFLRQYARKKHAGQDPNDRRYDRDIEKKIKKMNPIELDALLRGEDDKDTEK